MVNSQKMASDGLTGRDAQLSGRELHVYVLPRRRSLVAGAGEKTRLFESLPHERDPD